MVGDTRQLFKEGFETISIRQFAKEFAGVSEGLVRKYLREGKLTPDCEVQLPRGGKALDLEKVWRQWQELKGEVNIPAAAPAGGQEEPPPGELNLARENALFVQTRRMIAERQLAELDGKLHHADDVRAIMGDMRDRVKARLRAIPAKVAPLLALESDAGKALQILMEEVNEALEELSEYDPKVFKRASRQRRRLAAEPAAE